MVLLGRIELPTSPLPRVRSTTELQQRRIRRALLSLPCNVKQGLKTATSIGKALPMSEGPRKNMSSATTREERLAAKLRENLRRRKAQARAAAGGASEAGDDSDAAGATETLSNPADES